MLGKTADKLVRPVGAYLQHEHMRRLGITNTMRLARIYNWIRRRGKEAFRRAEFNNGFNALLRENGEPTNPILEMNDGYVIDTSMTLPHLDRMLDEAEQIIAERSGVRTSDTGAYRSFFQNLTTVEDFETHPALLDFVTSSEVVSIVSNYLKCVPALSTVSPEALRLVESSAEYDDQPDEPHDSQLFHIDYYSHPNVYVIVLLNDVTIEHGPFRFLPASVSQKVAAELNYWKRGKPYRLSDEEIYSVVDESEVITFDGPKGKVLFIDPSSCFHYGSRNSLKPRYQAMYGFTSAVRTSFGEVYLEEKLFPAKPGDSRLRKMLLNKNYMGQDD